MSANRSVKIARLWSVSRDDNVAVSMSALVKGDVVNFAGEAHAVRADIPKGHKIAVAEIRHGEHVIKYGLPIGRATRDIQQGDHVHTHNVETLLNGVDVLTFDAAPPSAPMSFRQQEFPGYRRRDGRVGIRNEIWVIPTVGCVAKAAEKIASLGNQMRLAGVDGVYALSHPFGCSQLGDDLGGTRSILARLAAHPNVGGTVFIGLGCESNQLSRLVEEARELDKSRVRIIIAQDAEDEITAGTDAVAELGVIMADDKRSTCAISDLVIGVKCGGSDGFSGLTANPLVGRMATRVIAAGGAAILTEIPEMFGAEQLLAGRCATREVFDKFERLIQCFRQYFIDHGEPISENPSPGNIQGGITTLEEKSLGAVQKAGNIAPIVDVIRYGEPVIRKGLTILEAPGNDAVSSTALAAAGAQIILFTTGRGTPLGFPAPTIKIASNSELAQHKQQWIDFDAGRMLDDDGADAAADRLFDMIIDVASGAPTKNEGNNERSIAIWKRGVTL